MGWHFFWEEPTIQRLDDYGNWYPSQLQVMLVGNMLGDVFFWGVLVGMFFGFRLFRYRLEIIFQQDGDLDEPALLKSADWMET
jgi:hypothetical protein